MTESAVTQQDVAQFEAKWKFPVLKVRNLPGGNQPETTMVRHPTNNEIALLLNIICDQLWSFSNERQVITSAM